MGVAYVLIFIPITFFVSLTMIFGTPETSPLLGAVDALQTVTGFFDRATCETSFAECSNTDCSFFTGSFTEWPTFHLCGDLFYIALAIGSGLSVPALIIALPFLLMVGPTSITVFGVTYSMLTDFWFLYAPAWGAFGIGIIGVIW